MPRVGLRLFSWLDTLKSILTFLIGKVNRSYSFQVFTKAAINVALSLAPAPHARVAGRSASDQRQFLNLSL